MFICSVSPLCIPQRRSVWSFSRVGWFNMGGVSLRVLSVVVIRAAEVVVLDGEIHFLLLGQRLSVEALTQDGVDTFVAA